MQVATIDVDREKAAELFREYKAHRHYSTPVDDEIRKAYKAISQGKVVIKALESVTAAGVDADGFPKLAIARADLGHVHLELEVNGSAKFQSQAMRNQWRNSERPLSSRIIFPRGSFPARRNLKAGTAQLPLIPVHLRPRTALNSYHILWEAEWTPTPPRDPYLLRRIGGGDLWLVVAAWDLTEVERGALATRVTPN